MRWFTSRTRVSEASIETDFSGTTFTCCVIRDNKCVLANVGDSRTVLAFRNSDGTIGTRYLTIDHKPDLPEEKARIESKGGRVFAVEYDDGVDGPARVWLGHMDVPGLAMSRSLGDAVAHSAGPPSLLPLLPESRLMLLFVQAFLLSLNFLTTNLTVRVRKTWCWLWLQMVCGNS
jgi:serine/threonine protein phosphatase PrpC